MGKGYQAGGRPRDEKRIRAYHCLKCQAANPVGPGEPMPKVCSICGSKDPFHVPEPKCGGYWLGPITGGTWSDE